MSKIYIYGCSHATNNYNNVKVENSWMHLVSNNFKMDIVNYAKSGISNDYIFKKLFETISKISNDDIVIIQLTYGTRFMVGSINLFPTNPLYENYLEYTENNGLDINYIKNLLSIQNLIKDKRYIITSVDGFFDNIFLRYDIKNIFNKNNFKIFQKKYLTSYELGEDNKHLSETGHAQIGEWYNKILSKTLN
jgi:hypothetical protein